MGKSGRGEDGFIDGLKSWGREDGRPLASVLSQKVVYKISQRLQEFDLLFWSI
jgi:hypothetical protein